MGSVFASVFEVTAQWLSILGLSEWQKKDDNFLSSLEISTLI